MATSYTEFRGRGFWSNDLKLELFLFLLSRQIGAGDSPPWLLAARDDWFLQATVGFHGCVSASLDEHVGDHPDRLAVVRELTGRARMRLLAYFPTIPLAEFTGFGLGTRMEFREDIDVTRFLPVSEAFDQLLAGRVQWDHTTSPVF